MKQTHFSIKKRIKSFSYAFNGLKILFLEEHNARIHLLAALLVISFSVYFQISYFEWIAVIFCVGLVISMEILNSTIEKTIDFVSTEHDERIKKIKDLAAAAVFISAISAFMIGLIIFLPKVLGRGF